MLVMGCSIDFSSDDDPEMDEFMPSVSYKIELTGQQEVPMVETDSVAYATIEYDANLMKFRAWLDVSSVDGYTAAHIHQGHIGMNGDVAFAFAPSSDPDIYKIEETMLDTNAVEAMFDGAWYVNLHTSEHPMGELRGQILSDNHSIITFKLSGSQEVPAVDTQAMGYGYASYDSVSGYLNLKVMTMDLASASASHIHTGRIGENGGVLVGLVQSTTDTSMWMTPDDTMLDAVTAAELMAGGHYVNVHSTNHAGGEIRGQILMDNYKLATFALDGEQEVPAVDTSAMGSGYALINLDNNHLELKLVASGVDDASAAHIHTGRVGMNGGAAVSLIQGTSANIWMTPDNTMLDNDTLAALMSGGHYVNIHTPANASGEIRGQILTSDFSLLTFGIDGVQEVPAVTTSAMGDGYALVNMKDMSIELRAVTTGVSDATMAHIHSGTAGSNGGVVVALEQSSDDMNVWMTPGNSMLDQANFEALWQGGHYVNIHTPANASGEIRGQILP
ncbi:hypothetical protein XM47_15375 [Catenovulum maritimum]|uniref:CHRD domain-containing protein n=2 Tax=Catenovulum maritimum TaxID=1513271 RepID=A0A0J8GN97_9ALTE|nr:hypothetical protein XM47_15375 [Catenovulum maritimum]